ncbi:MAG: hypothetical protein RTV31_00770 [Candidatus Thorarchaeota archaeon]
MFEINTQIKNNRALYWAGLIQLFYGLFELTDTLVISLISIGVIPNLYTSLVSVETEIGNLLESLPIIFIPIFAFITSLRLLSGYWILQNKVEGIWTALLITGFSIVAVWFFLPFSAIDLVIIGPFIILLFVGYSRGSQILQE